MSSLNSWSSDDKPRERLKRHGVSALADHELLAIMLGSGIKGINVVDLARGILDSVDGRLSSLSQFSLPALLARFRGIGEAKGMQILAAIELGRRRSVEEYRVETVRSSSDIVRTFAPLLADSPVEQVWVLLLNSQLGIIHKQRIAEGGVSSVIADPKLILRPAVERLASSIAICHNHPSGSITPSREDRALTEKIKQAADIFDIRLVDHVIVTPQFDRYYSFMDNNDIL